MALALRCVHMIATAKRRVLIVEDDPGMNTALQRKFAKQGFEAAGSLDGEQALELMARERFDCVLLDLMMPKADGFAVLSKKGQTQCAATPAYVLTTVGQEEQLQRARELGARRVYLKSETSAAQVVEDIRQELTASTG